MCTWDSGMSLRDRYAVRLTRMGGAIGAGQQLLYRPTELPVTDHAIAHERFVAEALVVRKINPAPYQDAFLVFVR